MKFTLDTIKLPKIFSQTYPNSSFQVISPDNFYELSDLR